MTQFKRRCRSRAIGVRALTLVELLIVIAIIVLLASVTLPSMKTILKDRKTNQGALKIRAYIESAKSRAISKNRDVAVVLERLDSSSSDEVTKYIQGNTCIRLSMADVLPPYQGDIEGATVEILLAQSTVPPYNYSSGKPIRNVVRLNIASNPTAKYFLNLGDLIAFDDQSQRFEILAVRPDPNDAAHVLITIWNQPHDYNYAGTNPQGTLPESPIAAIATGNHRFRIYSKPRRLFAKTLDLPKGTCVDLSLSGWGTGFEAFQPPPIASQVKPQSPNGREFSTEMIADFDNLSSSFFKPVYLVFNSRGTLAYVWQNTTVPDTVTDENIVKANFETMGRYIPTGNIYLMVGRTDQVFRTTNKFNLLTDSINDVSRLVNAERESGFLPNLADTSAYWVRISEGGQVSSAPNVDPRNSGLSSVSDLLGFSRGFSTVGSDASAQ